MSVEIIVNRTERKVEIEVNRAGIKGDTGKTAYQSYLDTTTDNPVLTEAEWSERAKGDDGKSAYEVAVENGYVGSETDWLLSLKGADGQDGANGSDGQDGAKGDDGDSAYQVWLDAGNTGTPQDFLDSLKGEDGVTTVVGGEISNKGTFVPTDNTIPASQKSTADYINRDGRDFRENIPTTGFDLNSINKDGVYPMYGSYGSTLIGAPSYFSSNKRVRGTLTFNRSAQTGELGSSYILNFWNEQQSRMRLFFGAKYGGLINWQEVDVIGLNSRIDKSLSEKPAITNESLFAKDLPVGVYITVKLADYPQRVLSASGSSVNMLIVNEFTQGKFFTLRHLSGRGNIRDTIFFGKLYYGDTDILWSTFEPKEDGYGYGFKYGIVGDSIASTFATYANATLKRETGGELVSFAYSGSTLADRDDLPAYKEWSFVNRTYSGATQEIIVDDLRALVIWGGVNDATKSTLLGEIDSTDITTIAGALNVGIGNLLAKNPTLRIIVMTPNNNPSREITPNSAGLFLSDYSNHIIKVCNRLSVKCIDLLRESNINTYNSSVVLPDNLHPIDSHHYDVFYPILKNIL